MKKRTQQDDEDNIADNDDSENLETASKKRKMLPTKGPKLDDSEENEQMITEKRKTLFDIMTPIRNRKEHDCCEGEWISTEQKAAIYQVRGKVVHTLGEQISTIRWLLPEETFYLFDRGAVKLHFNGKIMTSLQEFISLILSQTSVTIGQLTAYIHLKRLGFIVKRYSQELYAKLPVTDATPQSHRGKKRAGGDRKVYGDKAKFNATSAKKLATVETIQHRQWYEEDATIQKLEQQAQDMDMKDAESSLPKHVKHSLLEHPSDGIQSLLDESFDMRDGLTIDLKDLYAALQVVGKHQPAANSTTTTTIAQPQLVLYDVWKRKDYVASKSKQQNRPSFVVAVSQFDDAVPNMATLVQLQQRVTPTPVYFAVINFGSVSFMHLEAPFSINDL